MTYRPSTRRAWERRPGSLAPGELEDLVRAAQRGDTLAMGALVDELLPFLGRLCGAVALERGDDALQETMIEVLRHLPDLREPAALRTWVRRIALRKALRLAPGHREVPLDEADDALLLQGPSDTAVVLDVRDALARLSPEHRAVLVLRDVEELTEDEVARLLGLATGTVKSRLHRARAAFRADWGEQ